MNVFVKPNEQNRACSSYAMARKRRMKSNEMKQILSNNSTTFHYSRDRKWDFLRGLAIFLVLLGHTLQWFDPNWRQNPLFEGIYSFHMPLFMFISGYFLRKNLDQVPFWEWQKQKARQLFLPSVVNSIVFSLLIYFIICQGWSNLKPIWYHEALWYLNTLFAFFVVARIIAICRNSSVRVLLWILFYSYTFFLNFYPIGMYLKFMLPFFLLGISYRKLTNFKPSLQYYVLVPGALLAVWVFPMWNFSHSIYMLPYAPLHPENIQHFLILYANGFAGICATMLLINTIYPLLVSKKSLVPFVKTATWVGTVTLPIYVVQTHFFVVREVVDGFSQNFVLQCATALALIPFCWGIYRAISFSSILKLLFFGEKTRKRE